MTESFRWRIPCTIMRGGTSKGVFLRRHDLPADVDRRNELILKIFGSPDRRQVDGLGGADPLTSKVAIIGEPTRSDADLDYTFGQVEISIADIDYGGICGNISSAVAAYAVQEGFVPPTEPVTHVRIHQTNTGGIIHAAVPVRNGEVEECGDFSIAGVPGSGAEIELDFAGNVGSVTGKLLPTGHALDIVEIDRVGPVRISVVDVANPMIFVLAGDFGVKADEGPDQLDGRSQLFSRLEQVRHLVARNIGLPAVTTSYPLLSLVRAPAPYRRFDTGEPVSADAMDIWSRELVIGSIHKTHSTTASACLAAAACIPGTLVNQIVAQDGPPPRQIRIGHPSGVLRAQAEVSFDGTEPRVEHAIVGRTARRIMDGVVSAWLATPQPGA